MFNRLILLLALIAIPLASADTLEPGPLTGKELTQGYRDGYVMAKPKARSMSTVAAAEKGEGLRMRKKFDRFGGLRVLKLAPGESVTAAVARLQATGRYEFVEPDYTRTAFAVPNDAWFLPDPSRSMSQWGLNNDGAEFPGNGVLGADIHAEAAWDVIHDAPNVIVAVLDTGLYLGHPDIGANLWSNPTQLSDGYPVGIHGLNMSENGASVTDPSDDNGHGTHVSGILGAVGNNGIYFAGVAWKVQIMALKWLGANGGSNSSSDEVACIDFAIAHGANIINASFGSPTFSSSEYTAIQSAGNAGIIFVAAAGNRSDDNDLSPNFPASYLLDNIVAVAASDNRDDSVFFTSYGCGLVDLSAPGEYIFSLWPAPLKYQFLSGTSMAAPFVTGSLALLKAQFPTDTSRQLINRLLSTVDRNVNFIGKSQTGGRLNLAAAVTSTSNRPFNDAFANRARITGPNVTVRSNNSGATRETGEPVIGGNPGGASLWWEWTAPTTGSVNVATTGSAYATLLAVYTGTSVGALTPVASSAAAGAGASAVTFSAQAGVTYEVSADGQGGATGLTVLNFSYGNDAFATPIVLTGASAGVTASNLLATGETGEPQILGHTVKHSVWYAWTAPKNGAAQVSAFSFDFDPLLAVYTGTSLSALSLVSSSSGSPIKSSTLYAASIPASFCSCAFTAAAGTTYYLTVDGFADSSEGTGLDSGQFTLALSDATWAVVPGAPVSPGPVDDSITCSPAVGSDGSIYVGSKNGYFYAFRPDGSVKWKINTLLPLDLTSAAISSDGTAIYVGGSSYIYAFSTVDGSTLWQYSPGNTAVTSTAVGADGTIYVKTTSGAAGTLYALNPGTSTSGRVKWTCSIPGSSTAAPVIASNGIIYIGATDSNFYAVNASNGTPRTFAADGSISGAAAIDSGGNVYFGTLAGTLYAVSPTGVKLWFYTAGGSIDSAPVIGANGVIYFGSHDRNLYAVNLADGSLRWTCPLGDEVRGSSPAIDSNGLIYVGCYDNNVYAVNPSGTVNRTFATNFWVQSSPVIANGMLYFGSSDHKLYAFSIGANAAVSPWPMYQYNASRTGQIPAVVSTQPQSQTLSTGSPLTLTVAATGLSAVGYQWDLNGVAISGATGATYSVASFGPANVGVYTAVIATAQGSITSNPATIASTAQPPAFTVNPVAVNIAAGRSAAFSVAASGSPTPTFQWNLNGAPIGGATDPVLLVSAATSANAGTYTCTAANSVSSVTSTSATLTVTTTSNPGFLSNLSARAQIGTGNNILIGGYAIGGTGTKQLLVRGVGPALAAFFGSSALATPPLTLLNGGSVISSNTNWAVTPTAGPSVASDSPMTAASLNFMNNLGAFQYTAGSLDTAMDVTAPTGNSTAQVSGVGGATGIGLVEFYDADAAPPAAKLVNISARADVGTSNNILIGGFAIGGATADTVLIRAVGPGLNDLLPGSFPLSSILTQPVLTIYQGGTIIYSNTIWGGDTTEANVFPTVGAFNLVSGHQDSVLLISLAPGNYTAQVSGLNSGTGIALCEIYEVQ